MSLWKQKVGSQSSRVKALSKKQMLSLSYACVNHAYNSIAESLRAQLPSEYYEVLRHGLEVLRNGIGQEPPGHETSQLLETIAKIRPEEGSAHMQISGWENILLSMREALCIFSSEARAQHAIQSMSYAYETVAEDQMKQAMLRHGGLIGKEITAAEKKSILCRSECEFQLGSLEQHEK
jgi:hypothetical protein